MFKFQLIENNKWETIQLFQEIRDGMYYGQDLYPLQSWRLIGLNYCYYSPWWVIVKLNGGNQSLNQRLIGKGDFNMLEQLGMLNGRRFYDWSQLEMERIYKGKLKTGENIIFYPCEHDMWISHGNGYSVKAREKKHEIIDVFTRKRFFLHDFMEIEPTELKKEI